MTRIRWQKVFDTGIRQIDEQHKKLVAMINQLEDSTRADGDAVEHEIGLVLKKLIDYTRHHFSEEERVMDEIRYINRFKHAEKHRVLVHRVVAMLKRLKSGGTIDAYELMSFLRDWLLDHIVLEDVKIGEAYREWHQTPSVPQPPVPTSI